MTCGACRNRFAGVRAFDGHRRGGKCVDPTAAGLRLLPFGEPCWAVPNPGPSPGDRGPLHQPELPFPRTRGRSGRPRGAARAGAH